MRTLLLASALVFAACSSRPEVCVEGVDRTAHPLPLHPTAGALVFAHAHNDYEHEHPLEDALAQGFHSVEADVYFAGGRFEVSHLGFSPVGTLAGLYLEPLQRRVDELGGKSVLPEGAPFTLWIDLKDQDPDFPRALEALLAKYPMLTTVGAGQRVGAVTVILTGDPKMKDAFTRLSGPRHALRDSNDFRPDDPPADDRWTAYALDFGQYVDWNGSDPLPAEEGERISCIVNRAHALGRTVRFYGTPDRREVWDALLDRGADFINTDDLKGLHDALTARAAP